MNAFISRPRVLLSSFVVVTILSGCSANWSTVDRTTELDFDNSKNGANKGTAIHLDAKQRLVIQKDFGVICAEPSPDALSALSANASAGYTSTAKQQIALAGAISEAAGSLGVRTQSIQLMRDALYRVCEMYFGRALNDAEVMRLHQKYQDTLLAVMAVEQLTGAVAAGPISLTTSGNTSSVARERDLLEDTAKARERVTALENELDALQSTESEKKAEHDSAVKALEALGDSPAPEESEKAKASVDSTKQAYDLAKKETEDKAAALKDAEDHLKKVEEAKGSSLASAASRTDSDAQLKPLVMRENIDEHTAQAIATSVENIVKAAFEKDYIVENCMTIMSLAFSAAENASVSERESDLLKSFTQGLGKNVLTECTAIVTNHAKHQLTDSDGDGVRDNRDLCLNTPAISDYKTDQHGCLVATEPGLPVIQFDSGVNRVAAKEHSKLLLIHDALRRNPNSTLKVRGYSDNQGDNNQKLAVSQLRADAATQMLIMLGVEPNRIASEGKGDADPIGDNSTAEGRRINRRVEFEIVKKGAS